MIKNRAAQEISNSEKFQSGKSFKEAVYKIISDLKSKDLIQSFEEEVSFSHRDFYYEKQFLSCFVLKTLDDKYIIIRASHSYRSDRLKILSYDILGIQNFSNFSGEIVASVLLFPDSENENTTFISTREKVVNGEFYSPATHWLTYSQFTEYIENYCSEVDAEKAESENEKELTKTNISNKKRNFDTFYKEVKEDPGSYYGKIGNAFEKYLVLELNDIRNLHDYKEGNCNNLEYDVLLNGISKYFDIDISSILFIEATNTISKLKNFGSPKTDLHIKLFSQPNNYKVININVKNTKAKSVSCHDYQAKDFSRVIAPNDKDFERIVDVFQAAGSWSQFERLIGKEKLRASPYEILDNYMDKIITWAITGDLDKENILDRDVQIANSIFTRNSETGECYFESAESYINKLSLRIGSVKGAPFSWTYPSKRRGTRIQLKMPITKG